MQKKINWDLTEIVPMLLSFRQERAWEQFHRPKEIASAIIIESAELLENFLWRDMENVEDIKKDLIRYKGIQEEIADLLIYIIYLSFDLKINLFEALIKKIEKNKIKYPKEKYTGRI